jgi:hypothetical protein
MVAIYRMEYFGWNRSEAMHELKAHGFGDFGANATNDYIAQYVLRYEPGLRHGHVAAPARAVSGQLMARPKP